jgi:hypothetical protein
MGSLLPLIGIAALLVFGFVVLITALTYDPLPKPDKPRARAWTREQRKQLERRRQPTSPYWRTEARKLATTLQARAMVIVEQWPRWGRQARHARLRWLSLETTSGQLIAVAAGSLVLAYVIVLLGS